MCLIFVGQRYRRKLFNLEHFPIYGIFIVADIYEQEPTSGEFLSTYFKNTILQYSLQLLVVVMNLNHLQSFSIPL